MARPSGDTGPIIRAAFENWARWARGKYRENAGNGLSLSISASAQGVGAIGGTIADASGGILPGVTVTLTSATGGIGDNQHAVSDDRGAYQFTRLVAGRPSSRCSISSTCSIAAWSQPRSRSSVRHTDARGIIDGRMVKLGATVSF